MDKVLSISIASYNVEEFLENTVMSVVDGGIIDDVEIIIVNDGSKDDTITVANKLKNEYPDSVVVIDKENGGYGSTINASIEVARGKYYKLLDGDDFYDPEALPEYIEYLSHADADMVISPYYEVREDRQLIDRHPELGEKATKIEDANMTEKLFYMHEIAIRSDALRKGMDSISEHCFYTDSEFVFNCFISSETISRFPKGIYCYRLDVEGQSVSLEGIRKHHEDHPKVMKKLYGLYEKNRGRIEGTKKEILEEWLVLITRNTFISYMVLENAGSHRGELIRTDQFIKKEHSALYETANRSALVQYARMLHFRPYWLFSKWAIRSIG